MNLADARYNLSRLEPRATSPIGTPWGDSIPQDPSVLEVCALAYELLEDAEVKAAEIERLNLALIAASEPDLLKRGSRR